MEKALQHAIDAKADIDRLTKAFYALFSNRDDALPDLERIFSLFIPQGIITKNSGQAPEVSDLQGFIAPRRILLSSGTLVDFFEEEQSESTFVFGNIAHRISAYRKSGCLDGTRFSTQGMKSFQFVNTPLGWRMSAMAWDDEREGLALHQVRIFGSIDRLPADW